MDGTYLASIANYGVEIKSNSKNKANVQLYYTNLPIYVPYGVAKRNPNVDFVMAIKSYVAKIKDRKASKKERVFYLKLLFHFVGDPH